MDNSSEVRDFYLEWDRVARDCAQAVRVEPTSVSQQALSFLASWSAEHLPARPAANDAAIN